MPDGSLTDLAYQRRLAAMAANFYRREASVNRSYALTELMQDAEELIRVAREERNKLRGM